MPDRHHALSFGPAAAAYDRHRPGYPVEALGWAIRSSLPIRVVDIGAGTGILTRALLTLGHEVLPVEPDEGMRRQLAETTETAKPLSGSAERLPLPNGSVDAVLAGQAYHWFDRDLAHPEIARVLRPGGIFAPMWNFRDETEPWIAELSQISNGLGGHRGLDEEISRAGEFGALFGPVERTEFRHTVRHTPDSLLAMMTTRSYYLTASGSQRKRFLALIRDLISSHPALSGQETFPLPYRTLVLRAERAPTSPI